MTAAELLDGADTPVALARVAGAVAVGLAETHMYWSSGSQPCRDYLAMLTGSGWTPDDWTAAVLARNITTEPSDTGDGDDATSADASSADDEDDSAA